MPPGQLPGWSPGLRPRAHVRACARVRAGPGGRAIRRSRSWQLGGLVACAFLGFAVTGVPEKGRTCAIPEGGLQCTTPPPRRIKTPPCVDRKCVHKAQGVLASTAVLWLCCVALDPVLHIGPLLPSSIATPLVMQFTRFYQTNSLGGTMRHDVHKLLLDWQAQAHAVQSTFSCEYSAFVNLAHAMHNLLVCFLLFWAIFFTVCLNFAFSFFSIFAYKICNVIIMMQMHMYAHSSPRGLFSFPFCLRLYSSFWWHGPQHGRCA